MNMINFFQKLIDINDYIIKGIIDLISQDYQSYNSNLPLTTEEKSKELYLLKKKREPEINYDIIFQKEKNFSKINSSNLGSIRQINESINVINEIQSEAINYGINNFKIFLSESSNKIKQEENKPKIIIDNKEEKLINNSYTINNPSAKIKYFNIEKNISEKHMFDFDTNNEIKVLKNKKMVYINSDLLNNYSTSRNIKKLKNINFVIRNKTSSKYRGVSRNGKSNWQVIIMINNKRYYLGNYPSEELAARVYDIHAIKKRGIKARTNFPYNNIQLKNIFEKNINLKCNKIYEIMKQISN